MTKKGKKHRKRRNNPPQEIKTDVQCPSKENENDQELVGARSNGVGPSDQSRAPSLEPKHRIFLSHSGAQKDFTWQLCKDLESIQQYPFFDRCDDSLPKGEKFPPLIFEATIQCRVAVLVLSEEFFTRSKWPMLELSEFVTSQGSNNPGLKILPLFLGITMKQFHEKKRQVCWFKKWEEFACEDERIDVNAWKVALSKIPGGINAMEYIGVAEGEVAFREKVVGAICKLLPPDVEYDVSHVQSLEELCEPIQRKLAKVEVSVEFKVNVVGLYGTGGVGKTTISKAICNQMFEDFRGKVCHVELGGNDLRELKKRVLKELTNASATILENDSKLDYLLEQRMGRQKVFLVLDNVWDDQVEEALKYLRVGYHVSSMVLVTSRSLELLKKLGIDECNCMEMPNLEQEGAIDVFLYYLGVSRESIIEKSDLEIVQRCVMECYFSRGEKETPHWSNGEYAYHPLALKALGGQLHGMKMKDWNEIFKKLKVVQDKFNMFKDKVHPVFSILRLGFDYLDNKQQDIFMDLALIWNSTWMGAFKNDVFYMEWEWLYILHSMSEEDMIANVNALQRKGLLDKVDNMTKLEYNIHDLYFEFAKVEVQAQPFEERRILLDEDKIDVLRELQMYPPNGFHWPYLKRLIIYRSKAKSLKRANLHHCKNVEVLLLAQCPYLEEVDVTGMNNLRFLVVYGCDTLGKLRGLEMLRNLVTFSWTWSYLSKFSVPIDLAFSSTELRVVRLRGIAQWSNGDMFPVHLSGCTNLQELALVHRFSYSRWSMRSAQIRGIYLPSKDIGKYLSKSVLKLDLPSYPFLGGSPIMTLVAFTNLQDLNLCDCKGVRNLMGLCKLIFLQKLNVRSTGIREVPDDLWKLRHLHYLDVSNCRSLKCIYNIVGATALRTVYAYGCWSLEEVPYDFSKLQQLEVLDLGKASKILSLPHDYKRFAGYSGSEGTLKVNVSECWGLIVPLVRKLKRSEVSWVACEDGCNCGSESMALWVEAKKNVDATAYAWLKDVLGSIGSYYKGQRTYLLDCEDHEVFDVDVVIRGLCEHDVQGSRPTHRLDIVVQEVTLSQYSIYHQFPRSSLDWWIVVATAPCTFEAMTKGTIMEPWRKTLLHYMIAIVLPRFLELREKMIRLRGWPRESNCGDNRDDDDEDDNDEDEGDDDDDHEDERNNWFLQTWLYKAIVAVLQKCKEKLDNASEQGIDPARCDEGKKFVSAFLCELKVAKSDKLREDSILQLSTDALKKLGSRSIVRYKDLFPNYQFECTLATEIVP